MKGKHLFWFLVPLILVILWLCYHAFTTLNEPERDFKKSARGRGNSSEFEVKNPLPREIGRGLTEEIIYTINASSPEEWAYFDFSRGSTVDVPYPSSLDWDLGFKRSIIISNGGETNPKGLAGIIELRDAHFESVTEAPETGYIEDVKTGPEEMENPAIKKWYEYSYWTHILKPKNNVYVIRTADGRYAKMQILKYYCGRLASCYTIKYRYQGSGSRKFY